MEIDTTPLPPIFVKHCPRCTLFKSVNEFSKDSSRKDGLSPHCRKCRAAIAHKGYRDITKEKCRIRSQVRHNLHTSRLNEIKASLGCFYCPENDPCCLDFHHRDSSDKLFTIALRTKRSWCILLKEVEKCDVVCANCHRKHHAGRVLKAKIL